MYNILIIQITLHSKSMESESVTTKHGIKLIEDEGLQVGKLGNEGRAVLSS